jgi:hypothetical protein
MVRSRSAVGLVLLFVACSLGSVASLSICTKGYYCDTGGCRQGTCKMCPAGKYQNTYRVYEHTIRCKACPKGQYSHTHAKRCTACKSGMYQPTVGSGKCHKCTKGYTPGQDFTKKNKLGHYNDRPECIPCIPGKFAIMPGSTEEKSCRVCPTGKYQSFWGQPKCTVCEMKPWVDKICTDQQRAHGGHLLPCGGVNTWKCQVCAQGQFAPKGDYQCRPCSKCSRGSIRVGCKNDQSGKCTICPAGKFASPSAGGGHCKDCALGFFTGSDGSEECSKCLLGSYTPKAGATACRSCMKCNAGTQVLSGCGGRHPGKCVTCSTGKFKVGGTTHCTTCQSCQTGFFRKGCGQSSGGSCVLCPAGKYVNYGHAHGGCLSCPCGKYTSHAKAGRCSSCKEGMYAKHKFPMVEDISGKQRSCWSRSGALLNA